MNLQNECGFSKSSGIITSKNNGGGILTRIVSASFITFNPSVAYTLNNSSSPDFSAPGGGRLTYIGNQAKTFFVKASLCFTCSNTSATGTICLGKTSSQITATQQPQKFSSSSSQLIVSYGLVSLAKNDYLTIYVRVSALNLTCTFYSASISAEAVGS